MSIGSVEREKGEWLWPGFGENSRVLKWIFERTSGKDNAVKTPIGYVPQEGSIDTAGLNISSENMAELLKVDVEAWRKEAEELENYFKLFGDRLPTGIKLQLANLKERLK